MPKSNKGAEKRKRNPKAAGKLGEAVRSIKTTEDFERALIERAQGDDAEAAEAGREILYSIALAIDAGRFDSLLFPFLADCLMQFAQDGKPLEQALWVVPNLNKGGTKRKYVGIELAAVDILLRKHVGLGKDAAIYWIEQKENIGASASTVRRARAKYDLMESFSRDDLLHFSDSLRSKVAKALSQ